MVAAVAPSVGLSQLLELDVFLATHGWWPWLLLFGFIVIVILTVVATVMLRRRQSA
jgi:hypothetical protein